MDVLYLVPMSGCPEAKKALGIEYNKPFVKQYQRGHSQAERCLNVVVLPSQLARKEPWSFTISNQHGDDIYIPMIEQKKPVKLIFTFGCSKVDPDCSIPLRAHTDGSGCNETRITVLDPLNSTGESELNEDDLTAKGRVMHNPRRISIGPYRFKVFKQSNSIGYTRLCDIATTINRGLEELQWVRTGRVLGKGAFGNVYAVLGYRTGQMRACKAIDTEPKARSKADASVVTKMKSGCRKWYRERQEQTVENEIAVMKELSGHKHVLECFQCLRSTYTDEYGETQTLFCMMLPLCHGTLSDLISRDIAFTFLPQVAKEMMSAVNFVHSHRVTHRDIKSSNILFRLLGRGESCLNEACDDLQYMREHKVIFILGDLGLAKMHKDGETMASFLGTIPLMAPELGKPDGYDNSVDIFSIGSVFLQILYPNEYQLINGLYLGSVDSCFASCPYREAMTRHRYKLALSQRSKHDLASCISKMLDPDPFRRPMAGNLEQEFQNLHWDRIMKAAREVKDTYRTQQYERWVKRLHPPVIKRRRLPAPQKRQSYSKCGLLAQIIAAFDSPRNENPLPKPTAQLIDPPTNQDGIRTMDGINCAVAEGSVEHIKRPLPVPASKDLPIRSIDPAQHPGQVQAAIVSQHKQRHGLNTKLKEQLHEKENVEMEKRLARVRDECEQLRKLQEQREAENGLRLARALDQIDQLKELREENAKQFAQLQRQVDEALRRKRSDSSSIPTSTSQEQPLKRRRLEESSTTDEDAAKRKSAIEYASTHSIASPGAEAPAEPPAWDVK